MRLHPKCFPVGSKGKWSWLYIGPKNSRSALHVDATSSAWNAVLSGRKQWVAYPPEHPVSIESRGRRAAP